MEEHIEPVLDREIVAVHGAPFSQLPSSQAGRELLKPPATPEAPRSNPLHRPDL